jgi:thiol-disulfide isomerase/thioredoxin
MTRWTKIARLAGASLLLFLLFATAPNGLAAGLEEGIAPVKAPAFPADGAWLNSPPLDWQKLRGKVVLVDFWTYSCVNCVRTFPHLVDWYAKYRDKGFMIVGVHTPEFEFEKDPGNVKDALDRYGIRYPVLLDNERTAWNSYNNRFWPAHYLVNREGRVVYEHFGEGEYDVTENNIRALLGLNKMESAARAESPYFYGQTPETYLGFARTENFAGEPEVVRNETGEFAFPAKLARHEWALNGRWKMEAEKITAMENNAALRLNFYSRKVYLVLGSATGMPVNATILLNGKPLASYSGRDAKNGAVRVGRHRLYELIDLQSAGRGELEIRADAGLEAYAFTFGG